MKLRNRQSVLTSGEEGRAPRSWSMRFTTLLYYLVLLIGLSYLVYYIVMRIRYFETNGLVATELTQVAPTREGRIAELPRRPGDDVARGELLAIVEPGLECSAPDTTRLVNLALDARLAEARRTIVASQIDARRSRRSALTGRAGLELDAELRREGERLAAELENLETEYALLGTEVSLLQQVLADGSQRVGTGDTRCFPELVYAPFGGTIREIHRDVFSVVDAGEPILSLRSREPPVVVIARADPQLVESLFIGKPVDVRFPDGSEGVGVVDTVYAAAAATAALDLGEYPLLDGDLVMEILPSEPAGSPVWLAHDRLLVEIRGRRARR